MPYRYKHNAEFHRGLQDAPAAIAALQERWPAAFPRKGHLVRPLIAKIAVPVAAEMGWSGPYALAVLRRWKLRPSYCRAVLAHDRRVDLDGTVTEEIVADDARQTAQRNLALKTERRKRHSEAERAGVKSETAEVPATGGQG